MTLLNILIKLKTLSKVKFTYPINRPFYGITVFVTLKQFQNVFLFK